MAFYLAVFEEFYDDQHHHDQHAQEGIDDESGKEESIDCEERIVDGLVVTCIDRFYDRKKRGRSEYADCDLKDAPRRRGRDDRPHRVDETNVSSDYQSRGADLLASDDIARGGPAVQELHDGEEGEEVDGDAELDDGSEGGFEHGDSHDCVAVGVLERAVFTVDALLSLSAVVLWHCLSKSKVLPRVHCLDSPCNSLVSSCKTSNSSTVSKKSHPTYAVVLWCNVSQFPSK